MDEKNLPTRLNSTGQVDAIKLLYSDLEMPEELDMPDHKDIMYATFKR